MKRGQRFQTLGMRMLNFGRTLMRNYVAPESGIEPAGEWSQEEAPEQRFQPEPYINDSEFDSAVNDASSTHYAPPAEVQRAPRHVSPPQPESKSKLDPRLLRILAAHEQLDAKRDNIREEKKTAFETTEGRNDASIQRDVEAPPKRRRGRASFDYVETSPLKPVDEAAPLRETPSQMPRPDEDQEDTLPVDTTMMDFDLADEHHARDSSYEGAPEFEDMSSHFVQRAPSHDVADSGDIDYLPEPDAALPVQGWQDTPPHEADTFEAPAEADAPPIQRARPVQDWQDTSPADTFEASPDSDVPPIQRARPVQNWQDTPPHEVDDVGENPSPPTPLPQGARGAKDRIRKDSPEADVPPIQRARSVTGRQETPPADTFEAAAEADVPPIQRARSVQDWQEMPHEVDDVGENPSPSTPLPQGARGAKDRIRKDSPEADVPPIQQARSVGDWDETPSHEADTFEAPAEADVPPIQRARSVRGRQETPPADTFEALPEADVPPIQRARPVVQRAQDDVDDEGATEPLDMDAIRAAIEATSSKNPETPPVQRSAWQDDVDDEGATEPLDMDAIRAAIEATNRNTPTTRVQRAQPSSQDAAPESPLSGTPADFAQDIPKKRIQRAQPVTPDHDVPHQGDHEDIEDAQQPVDLFEALSRAGMIQQRSEAEPPENAPDDLLDFLNNAPPPPDIGGQETVQRSPDANGFTHYESPSDHVMRAETTTTSTSTTSEDSTSGTETNEAEIDKIAREVYSRLRNRLRIERERRDK